MVNLKKETRKSHIVPKSYLRYFTNNDGLLYVYNKKKSMWLSKPTIPSATCFENDFYKMPQNTDNPIYWENYMATEIEPIFGNVYKAFLDKINNKPNRTMCLNEQDKYMLLVLIIAQLSRTRATKTFAVNTDKEEIINKLRRILIHLLGNTRQNRRKIENAFVVAKQEFSDSYMFNIALERFNDEHGEIQRNTNEFVRSRNWAIIETDGNLSFFTTCDEPVVLYNPYTREQGIGKIGIANNTTFIYYPLSSKHVLLIFPKKHLQFVDDESEPINNGQKVMVGYKYVQMLNQLILQNSTMFAYGKRPFEYQMNC